MGELRHIATSARKRKWLVLIEIISRTLNFRRLWIGVKQIIFPLPLPSATSTLSKTIPRHVFIHYHRIHCFSISSEPEGQYWVNAGNEKANSCGMNAKRIITITLQDCQLRGTYVSKQDNREKCVCFFAGWSIAWYVCIRQNNHEKCVDGTKVLTWSGKETGEWQFYRFTMRFLSTLLVKLVTCFIICGNNVKITFVVWMKIDSVTHVAVFLGL